MGRRLALWFVLFVSGFLAAWILQYVRLQRVQQELVASTAPLASCQSSEQLSQLRDTATMMYLEAEQKNYGKAGEYSNQFFDQAQRVVSSTTEPAVRNLLGSILAGRDQMTADLAKGDAAALPEIQQTVSNLQQTARR
ncbi:MAG: hypothetical protein H0X25_23090 [Acidobacteriales bacterium]|nr:hypothetical protein [Terriglobales bacterium]